MAEAAQNRVQMAMKDFIENIDKTKLRPVQKSMYLCNADCMDNAMGSMEEVVFLSLSEVLLTLPWQVQRGVERCSVPAQRSQSYVQSELEHFQASLSRCVQLCQDDIKSQVGVNTPESELSKYRREFETCAISCCDKNIQKLPNLLIKIKEALESQA